MPNSDFWDSFAGGVANSMPRGMDYGIKMRDVYDKRKLRSTFADAEAKYDEDQRALEHLRKAQEKAGKAIQTFDENGNTQTVKSRAVNTYENPAWLTHQAQNSKNMRDEKQKQAFLQYGSPEQYMDYRIKQGQVSESDFKKTLFDGRKRILDTVAAAQKDPQVGLSIAIQSGALPRGTVLDPKTMVARLPNGKALQVTDQMYNGFLGNWRMKELSGLVSNIDEQFNVDTYGDRVLGVRLGNEKTRAGIAVDHAKAHYYGVSADEMQKNGDLGRGIKVGNFIDGTPGGKGGKTQGQGFNPLGKWDKSGVYTIDNVPFIAHTENGLAIPRLDGTGFYTEEESGDLVDKLIAAGYEVQKINDGGQVIPVIKTMRGPVPLSYGESMLATHARVYGQPTQAIPTTSMHNYAGTGVD